MTSNCSSVQYVVKITATSYLNSVHKGNKYINFVDVEVTVHRDKILIIKPTRCTNFSNLFWE